MSQIKAIILSFLLKEQHPILIQDGQNTKHSSRNKPQVLFNLATRWCYSSGNVRLQIQIHMMLLLFYVYLLFFLPNQNNAF